MLEVSARDTGYTAILTMALGHLLAVAGDDSLLV